MTDFFLLALLFTATGFLALAYDRRVPSMAELQQLLPHRATWLSIALTLVFAGAFWYVFSEYSGVRRIGLTFGLILGLLVFETVLLFSLQRVRRQWLAAMCALSASILLFFLGRQFPGGIVTNIMIVLASLGVAALLVRLRHMKPYLYVLVGLAWAWYDYWIIAKTLPRAFVPGVTPAVVPFFPVVTVGSAAIGSGDFFFLTIFSVFLLHHFSFSVAVWHIVIQAIALLLTSFLLPEDGSGIPYLLVMLPVFLLLYASVLLSRYQQKRASTR